MGLDYMAYQPIQLFINGQYWGLYNLREKVNEHYLFENHGANRDSSSIIMGRWVRQHGSSSDYMKSYDVKSFDRNYIGSPDGNIYGSGDLSIGSPDGN